MATTRERFGFDEDDVMREASRVSGRRCLLSFSTGKDSIGAAIAVLRSGLFDEVVPFYMYQIPGNLEFIEESLAYYERTLFGGRRIVRMPHPSIARTLKNAKYQSPDRLDLILDMDFEPFTAVDVQQSILTWLEWPETTLTAVGVRAADSQNRYSMFKRYGMSVAVGQKHGKFYPVFGWNKERLLEEISRAGVKLPVDYRLFGKTFDGLDIRFIKPLKEHFPRDYEKVLFWYPFVDAGLFRYERRAQA